MDITVKVEATNFRGAELGGGGGVSEGGLGIDAVAGGGGGLVVPAGGVEDSVGDGEVAGDCGGGEVEGEGVGDGAIEGEGEGEVVGGDCGGGEVAAEGAGEGAIEGEGEVAGGGLAEVEDTETDSFCPPRQCWPKVQMKWCSPASERVKLAGERVSIEMGFVELHVSKASFVTLATSCCPGLKLKTIHTYRKRRIDQTLQNQKK